MEEYNRTVQSHQFGCSQLTLIELKRIGFVAKDVFCRRYKHPRKDTAFRLLVADIKINLFGNNTGKKFSEKILWLSPDN